MKSALPPLLLAAALAGGTLLPAELRSLEHRCGGVPAGAERPRLDSAACLACHDGVIARGMMQTHRGAMLRTQPGSHPVQVSYTRAHQQNPRAFVTPAALDSRLQLVDGKVECMTCHVVSARQEWVSVALLGRRDICLGCHQK